MNQISGAIFVLAGAILAAAGFVGMALRAAGGKHTGEERFAFFLAVILAACGFKLLISPSKPPD